MSGLGYLVALLVSSGCMMLVDRRFRLVLWRTPRRAGLLIVIGIGFFLAWDLAAISAGHYVAGGSALMTGLMLAPELPVEELVFITFLTYITLVLWALADLVLHRREER